LSRSAGGARIYFVLHPQIGEPFTLHTFPSISAKAIRTW
jgi:hypothetical protein